MYNIDFLSFDLESTRQNIVCLSESDIIYATTNARADLQKRCLAKSRYSHLCRTRFYIIFGLALENSTKNTLVNSNFVFRSLEDSLVPDPD